MKPTMEKAKFNLRVAAATLAVLVFAVTVLVASHAHAAGSPEKSEHCATCHLLPQGLKWIAKAAGPILPSYQVVGELAPLSLNVVFSQKVSVRSIRGPPSLS